MSNLTLAAAKQELHPSFHWCVSVMTKKGSYEYLSQKRLVTSAISDSIQVHGKAHPRLLIQALAARPALLSDEPVGDLKL